MLTLALLSAAILVMLIAIYRKLSSELGVLTRDLKWKHTVERMDAVTAEFDRIREEPEWRGVIAELVHEEAERRLGYRSR